MGDEDQPCRVCLSEGTWNIFGSNVVNDKMCTAASINHIREKLHYVTQLQINANDGLPFRICELCIVQLNLAYRFKQLAADSDSKLREKYNVPKTPSPEIENALTNGEEPLMQEVPQEGDSLAIKQEQEGEITIGPTVVWEPSTEHYNRVNESRASHGTPDPVTPPAMVYLQKDIMNPAEDEAFIQGIIKKEVISIPWPTITEHSASSNGIPSSSSSQSKPPLRQQSDRRQKRRKRSTKRKRSASAQKGIENPVQKQENVTQKKAKQTAEEPVTNAPTQNHTPANSSEAAEANTNPSAETLRKKRLKKVLENLRIDMNDETLNTLQRNSLLELQTAPSANSPIVVPMKRRNSICLSSLRSWL